MVVGVRYVLRGCLFFVLFIIISLFILIGSIIYGDRLGVEGNGMWLRLYSDCGIYRLECGWVIGVFCFWVGGMIGWGDLGYFRELGSGWISGNF